MGKKTQLSVLYEKIPKATLVKWGEPAYATTNVHDMYERKEQSEGVHENDHLTSWIMVKAIENISRVFGNLASCLYETCVADTSVLLREYSSNLLFLIVSQKIYTRTWVSKALPVQDVKR